MLFRRSVLGRCGIFVFLFLALIGVVVGVVHAYLGYRSHTVFNLLGAVEFYSCDDSNYYSGHGVDALDTANLDDYVAAVSAQGSSFCFSTNEASQLAGLKLVWYSLAEAPKSIEVLGLAGGRGTTEIEVLWAKDNPLVVKSLSGFFYSELSIESLSKFSRFRVNYVAGAGQDRLLLRAVAPFFRTRVGSDLAPVLRDIHRVSLTAPYGMGVTETDSRDIDALASSLKTASSLHCGNYNYIFAYEISGRYGWSALGLVSNLQAQHAVVEIDYFGEEYTADPTLGALYLCSNSAMRAGGCDFSTALYTDTYNPVLWRYKGADFHLGAKVKSRYSGIQEYFDAYRKLDVK